MGGMVKGRDVSKRKFVPHCKPQVFDFNLRGQTLGGICSDCRGGAVAPQPGEGVLGKTCVF